MFFLFDFSYLFDQKPIRFSTIIKRPVASAYILRSCGIYSVFNFVSFKNKLIENYRTVLDGQHFKS